MNSLRLHALLAALFFGLAALPSRAQTPGPVHYGLQNPSGYSEGCYPPCMCPVFFGGVPSGSFVLQYTFSDPAGFEHYLVTNVDWLVSLGTVDRHVTGGGEYRRGGAVAVQEQLTLDLSTNGAAPEHFDSGLVTPQAIFPRIQIAISKNGMYCYDKVFDIVAAPDVAGVSYCFGDGTGTACPCGNAGALGNGCASSVNSAGANLSGVGTPSLSADAVVLVAGGLPNAPTLFYQGTQRTNGGAGFVFGDGLQCASGIIARLKVVQAVNGEARIPGSGDPPLSVMGGVAPGTYDYQAWHRDAPVFCTPSTFNLTNGYEIQWTP